MEKIDARTTALVVIDLQKGILRMPVAPHAAVDVLSKSVALADQFRTLGGQVVLVNVGFAADFADALRQPVDQPPQMPPGGFPTDWMDFPTELGPKGNDIRITKHQWGAFYGTELDLQLRRRGIQTIVMTGIATHIGVESTARNAWELGYTQWFAEDAMSSMSEDAHRFSVSTILPRLGRVRPTAGILSALT